MKAFVFTDKALTSVAGQFAWLALDTEKATNAAAVEKYTVPAWPSFFIVDPQSETVARRWTGGASVEQLVAFLRDGRAALDSAAAASGTLAAKLAAADRLYGQGAYPGAADAYAAVVAAAPAGWSELPRVTDAYLFSLQEADRTEDCVRAASELAPKIVATASYPNAVVTGLDCALSLDKSAPARAALVARFEKDCRAVLADPHRQLAVDDRSGIYQELIGARDDAGDGAAKKRLEAEWVAMLEKAAANARTPEERTSFDPHRISAYLEIGQPERAIPMLEASERDFPQDYNPPARLALAYNAMKQWDKALAASDRALAKAYGPRRLTILVTRADIFAGKGDKTGARKVLEQAIAEAKALPAGQRSERTISRLEKRLVGMG